MSRQHNTVLKGSNAGQNMYILGSKEVICTRRDVVGNARDLITDLTEVCRCILRHVTHGYSQCKLRCASAPSAQEVCFDGRFVSVYPCLPLTSF